jgi:hypothetical protein
MLSDAHCTMLSFESKNIMKVISQPDLYLGVPLPTYLPGFLIV